MSTKTLSQHASIKDYLSFTKAILSSAVGIPGAFVYLLVANEIKIDLAICLFAIFLLALGVCALNQFQERHLDALMPRTQNRPLVTGRISEKEALGIIITLIGLSFMSIYTVLGYQSVLIFAFVVFLYNGIYTPMKKINPYAVFPGALLGVIPPVICWMAAGQSLMQPSFYALAWFYFIWQIPHFWLLVLIYHKDYKKARFPTMVEVLGGEALARITYIWILFTIISALMAVSFFMPQNNIILTLILFHSIFLLYKCVILLKKDTWLNKKLCRKTFMQLNLYTLAVIGLLVLDKWI
ncbi:protoheme IX farnesyltransferase [Sulfurospirillum arcachonense]|uniref:protoheme IX farnesyltransferase n=1 Tax=Sulfurospirillum arcachonense TaxID=57666 RepID=UPI0004687137|nr:protoheme IX farnesyltransferase [Sulfurospirillum arcachonense]